MAPKYQNNSMANSLEIVPPTTPVQLLYNNFPAPLVSCYLTDGGIGAYKSQMALTRHILLKPDKARNSQMQFPLFTPLPMSYEDVSEVKEEQEEKS
ncbi:hypothetical protein JTE90_022507 [Oedothorax gibbosus]|uniref:Uncharacterized protein n=1 Tax=Oedothorax gibbosus TaxID=931172 RepID=A0AAV6V1E4_9ARAC|nr:hypothetical protein JTE90_022507 [Oedothorax gibbosus]